MPSLTFVNVNTPVWPDVLDIVTSPLAVVAFAGARKSPAISTLVVRSPELELSQPAILLTNPLWSTITICDPEEPADAGVSIIIKSFVLTSLTLVLFGIPAPKT